MSTTGTGFYVTGGTLRQDAPSYVERQADRELYEGLLRGEYCYVLHARQMGKSSLMVHTAARLRQEGLAVAVLDLTAIGQNLTPEQWYDGLLGRLGRELDLEDELEAFWLDHERLSPLQRFLGALEQVALRRCPGRLVLFLDEIDAVRSLPFSTDEFFAAIRECYNRRTQDPEYTRLTFCLLGVATPSDLIQDTRTTPFNIGRRIELTDFTPQEAAPLAQGLVARDQPGDTETRRGIAGEGKAENLHRLTASPPHLLSPSRLLERVLYWTGGHPYLTQRLCQAAAADGSVTDAAGIDRLCEALFFSSRSRERDDNLLFVRERLLHSEVDRASLLDLYAKIWQGGRIADDETSQLVSILRLSGITRVSGGRLQVRNRIYARVFDRDWITQHMPDAELRRQREAFRRGLLRATAVAAVVLAMVGGLAVTAVKEARRADRNARREQQQRRLADERARTSRRERYAAQMNLAQQAWDASNTPRAMELLAAQRPEPGQEGLRGFEWRCFWRLTRQDDARVTLPAQESTVLAVAFSPDGRQLATSCFGQAARLWDLATRRPIRTLAPPRGGIRSLAFSPDGKLLATGGGFPAGARGRARAELWEVATGRLIGSLPVSAEGIDSAAIGPLVFSPDGKLLAGVTGRSATLWQVSTRRVAAALAPYQEWCSSVAFSPDGQTLATTGDDAFVRLWNVRARRQVAVLSGSGGRFASVAFSPDGKTLAAGSAFDGTVKLWDLPRRQLAATLVTHGTTVRARFSPDGQMLAAVTGGDTAQLWSMATREEVATLRGHQRLVTCAAFSPDSQTVATGSDDRTVKLWSARPRNPDLFQAHSSKVQALAVGADGKTLVTGGVDHTIKLWEIRTKKLIAVLKGHTKMVYYVDLSPDGRTIASASDDGTARLWDLATRRPVLTVPLRTNGSNHQGVFSRDGKIWFLGEDKGTIDLWDVATRRKVGSLKGHTEFIGGLFVSPDGQLLSSTSHDLQLKLWDIARRRELATFHGFRGWLGGGVFSPDGRTVAAVAGDSTVHIWEVAGRREVALLKVHLSQISQVAFCPDGKTLATSSVDQTTKLWSTASWSEAGTLKDSRQSSWAVAFTPDGNTLVMGREDGMVRFWHADPLARAEAQANAEEARTLRVIASGGDRRVALRWQPLPHAVGYNLYRAPAAARPGELVKLNPRPVADTSFTDQGPGLVNGRAQTYAVAPLFASAGGRGTEGPRIAVPATPLALPPGWLGSSINEGRRPGSVRFRPRGDEITLRGSGDDIWGDADGCYFASQAVAGDFEATVKMLTGPTASNEWAKAGLMLRDSVDPGARWVALLSTPIHGVFLQGRPVANMSARGLGQQVVPPARLKLPILLRLTRQGSAIRAEYSQDGGRSFQPAGAPLTFDQPLPLTVSVGLAITAHDPGKLSEAKFSGFAIRPR